MSRQMISMMGGSSKGWCVLVHGGAGNVPMHSRPAHAEGCRLAVRAAADLLRQGGTALDAVERAVRLLEDDPPFNAGTGASLNVDGKIELDASIMDGATLRAGAVCAMPGFNTPIAVARKVLETNVHVLYAGEGARRFALANGFVEVPDEVMITPASRAAWEAAKGEGASSSWAGSTVGAVAIDAHGRTAAATSTGGLINKPSGRVGDTPIIGAGTYADDACGCVSTTGYGEAMIRLGTARLVAVRMADGLPAVEAVRRAIDELGHRMHAEGGAIAIDREGRWGWARSTPSMSWGFADAEEEDYGV
jgi:beta-aspartyl-peptidase (threonine type)